PLRVDLSLGAEPAARGARRRARRRADHAAALEPIPRAPRARPAALDRAVRGRAARLAARQVRPDATPPGRRGGLARSLRASRVSRSFRLTSPPSASYARPLS